MTFEEWKTKLDTQQTIESARWLSVALDDQFVRAVISNLLDYVKELSEDIIRLNLAQFDSEAIAKRDAFLSDENGKALNEYFQSVWGDLDERDDVCGQG